MTLGRSGECWFLAEGEGGGGGGEVEGGRPAAEAARASPSPFPPAPSPDDDDWDERARMSGAMSPVGYSSGEDGPAFDGAVGARAWSEPPRAGAVAGSAPPRSGSEVRLAPRASTPSLEASAGGGGDGWGPRTASTPARGGAGGPPLPPGGDEPGMLGGVMSPEPVARSPIAARAAAAAAAGSDAASPEAPPAPPSSSSSDDDDDTDAVASPSAAGVPPARRADDAAAPPTPLIALALVPPADIVGAGPAAVRAALDAGAVTSADWRARGKELVASPHLLVLVGGVAVHRWADAGPALIAGLAFGGDWAAALPPPLAAAAPPGAAAGAGDDGAPFPRLGSLRGWLASFRPSRERDAPPVSRLAAPDAERDAALAAALACAARARRHRRTFLPTPAQLAALPLAAGRNTLDFVYGRERLRAYAYVLAPSARVVVSDIDGTVTRSDMLGHVLPRVGLDWSHGGIARLFTDVAANGYDVLYLSSRSIAQASATRDYLHSLDQGGDRLPPGPVLMSPDGLLPSLYRELVLRRPHEFKIRCLEDVRALFPPGASPFYAGFGNRPTDEVSYLAVGVPPPRAFIINPRGELRRAAGGVATSGSASLAAVHAIVHDVFPPLPSRAAAGGAGAGNGAPLPGPPPPPPDCPSSKRSTPPISGAPPPPSSSTRTAKSLPTRSRRAAGEREGGTARGV